MILRWLRPAALVGTARALLRDTRGTEAVELAIVIFPFLYVLLVIIQMGLYYMTQSALDAGVNTEANTLRNSFNDGSSAPTSLPAGATIKASIVTYAGGLIYNNSNLSVDLRQLTTLDGGSVPITDGTVETPTASPASVPIVLRAQSKVVVLAPGFSLSTVQSAAILRFGAF